MKRDFATLTGLSIALLLFGILNIKCSRNPIDQSSEQRTFRGDSYFTFGHFYGECLGETCVEIFKIEGEKLFEDTLDVYPAWNNLPHQADYVQLSDEQYEKVRHITGLVPEALFAEDDVVIGQPDAGDWGGLYLETNMGGEKKYWLIDQMKSNIPSYLHALVDSLNSAVQQLQ